MFAESRSKESAFGALIYKYVDRGKTGKFTGTQGLMLTESGRKDKPAGGWEMGGIGLGGGEGGRGHE